MKAEKIIGAIILAVILMKLFHIPFAAPLLILSMASLSLLYFPFGFYFLNEKPNKKNLALSIIGGFLLFTIPLGILYKLMYWPGASQIIMFGAVSSGILIAIMIVAQKFIFSANTPIENTGYFPDKNLVADNVEESLNKSFYKARFIRASILFSLAVLFVFTSNATLIAIQHRGDPEMIRLKTQYIDHPENDEYKRLYDNYRSKKSGIDKRIK